MAIITDDMIDIIRRAALAFVATVNPDGTPNLSPKASLMARGDALLFADISSPRTLANLRRNPAIAVNVVDVFARRGYRFAGSAAILGPGHPDYDAVAEAVRRTNGAGYPVREAVRIDVADAQPLLSPAYELGAGVTEDGLRAAFLPRYGVRPL